MLVLAAIISGTFCLKADESPKWIFFPSVLLVSPALLLIFMQPTYLYFRYFIVCFPFLYLLLAYLICRCFRAFPKPYRLVLVFAIFVSVSGQATRIIPLLTLGRRGYSQALGFIVNNAVEPTIVIGSDNDFRNSILLNFYVPLTAKKKNGITYRSPNGPKNHRTGFSRTVRKSFINRLES
jgi:hypothetical protein